MNRDDVGVGFLTRRVPGFVWVRVALLPLSWRRPSVWWAVRGIVRARALGPVRLLTMRERSDEETLPSYRAAS